MEVIADTTRRKGKRELRQHLFITTLRTSPTALLHMVRQRWSIENGRHLVRDVRLGEIAHCYCQRNGPKVLALLRILALNLLRTSGFCSIREGQPAVSHGIRRLLGW